MPRLVDHPAGIRDADWRLILMAIALWKPKGLSIELMSEDEADLREQVTIAIADNLNFDADRAVSRMDALGMVL